MKTIRKSQGGFTLIEILIVLAVLGVLAAVVVPNVVGFLGRGGARALDSDQNTLVLAVQSFKGDTHAATSTAQWGKGSNGNWFPNSTGVSNIVELSTTVFDPAFPGNPQVMRYAAGPTAGIAAIDTDIASAAVFMGLLVQEPFGTKGTTYAENQFPGTAHPMANEQGQYIKELPKSASEYNTDIDATRTNGNCLSKGSYTWIVLDTGNVSPGYKAADGKWYAGNMGAYP